MGFLLNFIANQLLNVKQRPPFFMIKVRRFNVGLTQDISSQTLCYNNKGRRFYIVTD